MIVWLASFPRSGNTLFRMLLRHKCGITTYSVYDDPLFRQLQAEEAVGHAALPASLMELDAERTVYFVKTHDLPPDNRPTIYLVRDGRDALVSYARYLLSFEKPPPSWMRLSKMAARCAFRSTLKEVITSDNHRGGWSRNVREWTYGRRSGMTFPVRYEDLVAEPDRLLSQALDAVGVSIGYSGGVVPSFDELHAQWPEFFRRGMVGSWRDEMPPDLHGLFWRRHGEAMEVFRYGGDQLGAEVTPKAPDQVAK